MNLLFWNLKKNPIENWIAELLKERDVDIAVFAEYVETSFSQVEDLLELQYHHFEGYGACEKITILSKDTVDISVRREQNRYAIYDCSVDNDHFIIAGVHLPAPPNASASDRKDVIRDLIQDVNEQEKALKNCKTIIIGDFNCNPFDEEIIEKSAMNAVLFRGLIDNQEVVTHQGKRYRRFYNPTINYLSETTQTYGSIYSSSGNAQLYWNSFDQIMVRKELCDTLCKVEYLTQINGKNLIKDVRPNNSISDHLPLFVTMEKGD